jgi:hypothetical protein
MPERLRGIPKRDDLGMRRRILIDFATISPAPHDDSVEDDDRSDGYISLRRGGARLHDRVGHPIFITIHE